MVLFANQDHNPEYVLLVPDVAVVVVAVAVFVLQNQMSIFFEPKCNTGEGTTIIFSHNEGFLYNFIEGIFTPPPHLCMHPET